MATIYRFLTAMIILISVCNAASAQGKIGLDINGGALIHTQNIAVYGMPGLQKTTAMGGAVAAKVTYQAKYFEVGPYAEYGGMQRSPYFLLGGSANALIPLSDFQFYVGATGGYVTLGSESGNSIGAQAGGRYPIFSNLHFNAEVSFRHLSTSLIDFNAFGIMAGFHVKF